MSKFINSKAADSWRTSPGYRPVDPPNCKDEGKLASQQHYLQQGVNTQEIRSPETVIKITTEITGKIIYPNVFSPKEQLKARNPIKMILGDLVTAEKVARRQYDELLMFPELKGFERDIIEIRNDEHEHEMILNCIIKRLQVPQQPVAVPQPTQSKGTLLTKRELGEFYETILDRFGEEEEKSVKNYEEFLVKVQDSQTALRNARLQGNMSLESYNEAVVPLNELERKINKHLNEERVHLDVIDAMQEWFGNMKLGKVY